MVQFEDNNSHIFAKKIGQAMAIINLVAVAQFFEVTYIAIFKHFFAAKSTNGRLLEQVLCNWPT